MLFVNDGKGRFSARPRRLPVQATACRARSTSGALADYDRDGFLDLYLCTYGYFIGVSEDKAGPPSPYHDARNGSAERAASGTTATAGSWRRRPRWASTRTTTASASPRPGPTTTRTAGPTCFVANDFGRKNLYHNEGLKSGKVALPATWRRPAGVEDYGAGMSATFLDYDNDGQPRHLRGQHVDRGRAARDGAAGLHARRVGRRSARSTGATPAATRSSATGATAPSRT